MTKKLSLWTIKVTKNDGSVITETLDAYDIFNLTDRVTDRYGVVSHWSILDHKERFEQ